MKVAILSFLFLAISASASTSSASDADQHGKDDKLVLRDLKGRDKKHKRKNKKEKANKSSSMSMGDHRSVATKSNKSNMSMSMGDHKSAAKKSNKSNMSMSMGDHKSAAKKNKKDKKDKKKELRTSTNKSQTKKIKKMMKGNMSMETKTATTSKTSTMTMSNLSSATATVPPTDSTQATDPTLAPAIEIETKQFQVLSACPPAYDTTKTTYLGGDLVAVTDNIFECDSLLVQYCNIGEWDDALLAEDAEADEKWSDAWVHVGPCSVLEALVAEPTAEPTLMPSFSPTLAPSNVVAYEEAANAVPACPPAYNITKTDYLGGDKVSVTGNIFECHSLYVEYCNIGVWDAAISVQYPNSEEMWDEAWVHIGPCM
jgi:hypothetical protein